MENKDVQTGERYIAGHFSSHYTKLKMMALKKLAGESYQMTIQATVLVHDAFVRLMKNQQNDKMNHTGYFMASFKETIKRILIERAIRRKRVKHGGHLSPVDFDSIEIPEEIPGQKYQQFLELLPFLLKAHKRSGQVIEMYFLEGLGEELIAQKLSINRRTVQRLKKFGIAWLRDKLSRDV